MMNPSSAKRKDSAAAMSTVPRESHDQPAHQKRPRRKVQTSMGEYRMKDVLEKKRFYPPEELNSLEKIVRLPQLFTQDHEEEMKERRPYERFVKTAKLKEIREVAKSMDTSSVVLPQNYKYSSCEKYNDIQQVRDKLRRNQIDHLNFDSYLESEEGSRYNHLVYQRNEVTYQKPPESKSKTHTQIFKGKEKYKKFRSGSQPTILEDEEFVLKSPDSGKSEKKKPKQRDDEKLDDLPAQNVYEYLIKNGVHMMNFRKIGFESLTGSQSDNLAQSRDKEQEKYYQQHLQAIKNLKSKNLYQQFRNILKQMETNEIKIDERKRPLIAHFVQEMYSRNFLPINYQGSFRDVIKEINFKLDQGYKFYPKEGDEKPKPPQGQSPPPEENS